MIRRIVATAFVIALAGCGGGRSDLEQLAADTCEALGDPSATLSDRSLTLYESTVTAIGLGYTEDELAGALRAECPDSVIVGGEG